MASRRTVLRLLSQSQPHPTRRLRPSEWHGSCTGSECTLHQIAPYIGKMKSSMAKALVSAYSSPGETVVDPFAGSGAIPLECLISGRNVICADTNPYALTLTRAKLHAPANVQIAQRRAENLLEVTLNHIDADSHPEAPSWVRSFFHPRTLREALAFSKICRKKGDHFLMACFLGILHHERKGFLSHPASHLVPYLKWRKYARSKFPELYRYRELRPRLLGKILRVYRRPSNIDTNLRRLCFNSDATSLRIPEGSIDSIITSPPYMDTLSYVRDNRLRLWFLGTESDSDPRIGSPSRFSTLMRDLLDRAYRWLRIGGCCVLVMGDVNRDTSTIDTAQIVKKLVDTRSGGLTVESMVRDKIPDIRRTRRRYHRTETETILVLRKSDGR